MSEITALRHFDATEANVAELERLLPLIFAHIGPGPSFVGEQAEYDDLCRRFWEILGHLPSIDGWGLRYTLPDIDTIEQMQRDAAIAQDPEVTTGFESHLALQATPIRDYKYRLRNLRKQRIADEISSAVERAGDQLDAALADRGTEKCKAALEQFRGTVDLIAGLLGPSLTSFREWTSLRQGIEGLSGDELLEAVKPLWPRAQAWLGKEIAKDPILPPIEVTDLSEARDTSFQTKGTKLRGLDPTLLRSLDDGAFRDFGVEWNDLRRDDVEDLRRFLQTTPTGEDLVAYFSGHRRLLVQHMSGGHGRVVLSKSDIGIEMAPDFLVASRSSIGTEWEAIILGGAQQRMFEPVGRPAQVVTSALQQIQLWRAWLRANLAQAHRDKPEGGLGLTGISPSLPALVLVGVRHGQEGENVPYRKQLAEDSRIILHSYDYLLEVLGGRVGEAGGYRAIGAELRNRADTPPEKAEERKAPAEEQPRVFVTGARDEEMRSIVEIDGHPVPLGDRVFAIFLALVCGWGRHKEGWITNSDVVALGNVTAGSLDKRIVDLRKTLKSSLKGRETESLVERRHGEIRLAPWARPIRVALEELAEHDSKDVRECAKQLKDFYPGDERTKVEEAPSAPAQAGKPSDGQQVLLLQLVTEGRQLADIIGGTQVYRFDHDELRPGAETRLVGSFLQTLKDWGDIWQDIEVMGQAEAAASMAKDLQKLKSRGFLAFGGFTHTEVLMGHRGNWPIGVVHVARKSSPAILGGDKLGKVLREGEQ